MAIKLLLILLPLSLLYWLPYTVCALLLGAGFFFISFLWVCQKSPHRLPWRRRYLSLKNFIPCFLYYCLCFLPLFMPLVTMIMWLLFQHLCNLGQIFAESLDFSTGTISFTSIIERPAPAPVNPYRAGLLQTVFDVRLVSTGVSRQQLETRICTQIDAYDLGVDRLQLLQPQLAEEPGLPPLEAPKPLTPPSWPAASEDGRWFHWVTWLLWSCYPRLYSQLNPMDLGAIGILKEPGPSSDGLNGPCIDVRGSLFRGFEFNMTFYSDPPTKSGGSSPYMLVLDKGMEIKPHYFPVKTAAELEADGKLGHRPQEQTYRDSMAAVSRHLADYDGWRLDFLQRTAVATTFTEFYELHSEVCLRQAELLMQGQLGCVDEAEELLTDLWAARRMGLELMHPWFCREYSFSRATCEDAFQIGERTTDAVEFGKTLKPYTINRIEELLGELGRQSFYPFIDQPPSAANEWGALCHYWETQSRPPLERDLTALRTNWTEMCQRMARGGRLVEGQFDRLANQFDDLD